MIIRTTFTYLLLLLITANKLTAQNPSKRQTSELDSLKIALLFTKSDTARIGLQYAIGIKSDINRIGYWDSLLAEAHLKNMPLYEAKIYGKMGIIYFADSNVSKTIDQCTKGIAIAERLGNKAEALPIILYLAKVYHSLLDRKKNLLHIYKGLKIAEELKEQKAILDFYSEMALYYMSSGETNKALQIHFKCLNECKKIGYDYGIVSSLVDIGSDYVELDDRQKAGYYYLEGLKYTEKLKDYPFVLYHIYHSASAAYRFSKNYDSAIYYANKSYEVAKQMNSKRAIAGIKLALAGINEEAGKVKDAERLALQSLAICKATNYTAQLHLVYALLEKIYIKKNDFKKALETYKSAIILRDSLSNEQVRKQAMEKEFAYNYEKKEQAYNRLTQKNQIQILQLRQTKLMIIVLGIVLVTILTIAYLFIKQNKYKTEQTKMLLEQKLLLSQMNPHFIFNSLNSIQQFIMKGQNAFAESYLSKFSKLIRELLEGSTKEKLTIQEEVEILNGYLEIESLRFSHSFDYTISVDKLIEREYITIPRLMIQPFVENAIWHGLLPKAENRHLKIELIQHATNSIKCIIDDNGVGREATLQKELLTNKKSLAIDLIEKRIAIINKFNTNKASLKIIDKKDMLGNSLGTTIILLLPILNK